MTKGILDFGILREIKPYSIYKECHDIAPNQGKKIPQIHWRGCEDTDIDRESGLVFIACADHQGDAANHTARWEPSILLYDPSSDTVERLKIEFFAKEYKAEFQIHGISVFREVDGIYIYCVNHALKESQDSVYVFKFNPHKRELFQTAKFRHELMTSMNDIVAVGKNQFYATMDTSVSHGSPLALVENFLRLPITYVISCNLYNQTCTKAAKWIRGANGITFHNATNRILVSGALDQQIHVYKRHDDGKLDFEFSIPVGSLPDNLAVDENDVIWAALHPKVFSFLAAFGDDTMQTLAPSQIVAITLADNKRFNKQGMATHKGAVVLAYDENKFLVEQTMIDSGLSIISASTALPLTSTKTIITSVFQPKYLLCTMQDEENQQN